MAKTITFRPKEGEAEKWRKEAASKGKRLSEWIRARLNAVHKDGCGCEACR